MLLKGEIRGIQNNKYLVRIPSFESAGSTQQYICPAILAYSPGTEKGLIVGDKVIIGFENNNAGKPVIIGKLYTGGDSEAHASAYFSDLEVLGQTILSPNTQIGNISYNDLLNMQILQNLNAAEILNIKNALSEDTFPNVRTDDVQFDPSTMSFSCVRAGGTSEWDSWAFSKKHFRSNFGITFNVDQVDKNVIVGFGDEDNGLVDYFFFNDNGDIELYIDKTFQGLVGTHVTAVTEYSMERHDKKIYFYNNGGLMNSYTKDTLTPYGFGVAFQDDGESSVSNILLTKLSNLN